MSDTDTATPGPWTLRGPSRPTADTPEGGDFAIVDADGQVIAETFHRVSEALTRPARANAQLIAAAPAMLAKLRGLAGECAECGGEGTVYPSPADAVAGFAPEDCAVCTDIRLVIAQAEGRA